MIERSPFCGYVFADKRNTMFCMKIEKKVESESHSNACMVPQL